MNAKFLFAITLPLAVLQPIQAGPSDTLRLTLHQALDSARAAAVSVQLAHSKSVEMEQRVGESRGALLPHIGATATDMIRSFDLPAFGFSLPGTPNLVKPFNAQDARLNASLSLVDFSAWKRYEASRREQEGSVWEEQAASEGAMLSAALAYMTLARDRAMVSARQSELGMAEQLNELSKAQKQAGTTTRIEVLRAEGQLSSAQSALAAAMGDEEQARYALLRILGIDMVVYPALADTLSLGEDRPVENSESVLSSSLASRPDVMAAAKQAASARAELGSLRASALPTLGLGADYGLSGRRLNQNAEWTETVALQLNWNLWDGGERHSRRMQQSEKLRQAEIREHDARNEVEQEVRASLSSMRSTREQAAHALERVQLAEQEEKLAEDRFRAGASGNLEVITAQNSVSLAHGSYIDALYGYNRSRLAFVKAAHRLSDL